MQKATVGGCLTTVFMIPGTKKDRSCTLPRSNYSSATVSVLYLQHMTPSLSVCSLFLALSCSLCVCVSLSIYICIRIYIERDFFPLTSLIPAWTNPSQGMSQPLKSFFSTSSVISIIFLQSERRHVYFIISYLLLFIIISCFILLRHLLFYFIQFQLHG